MARTANRKRNLPHLASRLFATPLLADERKLDTIVPLFINKINGTAADEALEEDYREPRHMSIDATSGIAVISAIGSLIRRPTFMDAWSGLTSYGEISDCLDAALNDARVRGILFQIDSFGGEAPGCFELCDKIYNARQLKPIWAISDVDAFSAAYAILSSASMAFCAPRGGVGSIGVIAVHCERSKQNEMLGVTYTVFRAGERKGDFNPYEKLAPEAAQKLVASMERTRNVFVETVARNRPSVSIEAALATEGQWYDPEDGLTLGLIDGIATYEEAFSRLVSMVGIVPRAKPPADPPAPIEEEEEAADEEAASDVPIQRSEETVMDPKNQPPANPAPAAAAASSTVVDFAQPESRAHEIADLCKMAGFPASTPDFILSEMTVPDVRKKLTDMRAEQDKAGELSNLQPGKSGGSQQAGGNGLNTFVQADRPKAEVVQSWQKALAGARASNPKFLTKQ